MFQSIRDFKTRYVLIIKFVSTSEETLKPLLNIQIILSSNKIQLLQKPQLVHYFVKNLNNKRRLYKTTELCPLSKNMGNMHSSLANQICTPL